MFISDAESASELRQIVNKLNGEDTTARNILNLGLLSNSFPRHRNKYFDLNAAYTNAMKANVNIESIYKLRKTREVLLVFFS
jgi:hypothetical protein